MDLQMIQQTTLSLDQQPNNAEPIYISCFENHVVPNKLPSQKPADKDPSCLTLNAPIASKVVCFYRLLKCLKASMANSVDPEQTTPIGAVCSGSTLFASMLNLSVM